MGKLKEYIKFIGRNGSKFMKVIIETLHCKYCGSDKIVKFGTFRGAQRWWCNTCKRKFADNDACLFRSNRPLISLQTIHCHGQIIHPKITEMGGMG